MLLAAVLLLLAGLAGSLGRESVNFFEKRIKMGHLSQVKPHLNDLYQKYFKIFLEPHYTDRYGRQLEPDDWRTYSPENSICVDYLKVFIAMGYRLRHIEELVLLDSCLGYLYDDHSFKWSDQKDDDIMKTINALIRHQQLKIIYEGTRIHLVADVSATKCVRSLMVDSFSLSERHITVDTEGSKWIRVFNNYADCRQGLGDPIKDTYMSLLDQVVRDLGKKSFNTQIKVLNDEVEKWYQNEAGSSITGFIKDALGCVSSKSVSAQSECRHWPKKMMAVLQVVQSGALSTKVDLIHLQNMAAHFKEGFRAEREKFTENLARYINSIANFKQILSDGQSRRDPEGNGHYQNMIDNLCMPFRSLDTKDKNYGKYFDFNRLIMQLLIMVVNKDFFQISEEAFTHNVQERGQLVAPLYLATYWCRYMALTIGTIHKRYGKKFYEAKIADNAEFYMQIWPVAKAI